ncbi:MAG: 4-aminobutyrate--2-oxoglutarate transaminase [Desulfarculaceae bacterium]|nr:4-aminobutyrate--2-oxoglutarate transaminase [Desulfarculaceae bacterium]MCF8046469.1 4-aminobutyrate--2-oxoglutarate transaminase [Desulfarculaceae bacterium]MCF8065890.1 4-aminobutyrate--2-oxoglutarate transaminase [Desulfarculaceae bacterium]MCF8096464.1 4-aminobutyrate--2-oxoglutarate transaminase [Desulfarculaceae bacterium]MCF8121046.1 4-aminobutyrate--2-oxoglutarate transaminase [Desulfarculaceae bacterium]
MKQQNMQELAERRAQAVAQGVSNANPYFAQKAQGAEVWSLEGKRYLDFAGGIGVMNVGHSNPKVVAAIQEQAERFTHTCFNILMYEGYVELAEKLNQLTPGDFAKKTFFVNTGAEAVENAVKVARYYTKRPAVIVFDDAFHGRTLMTMTMTSKVKPYKFGFGPFAPEVHRIPFAYCYRCAYGLSYPSCGLKCAHALEDFFLKEVAAENTACVVAEPVQGEGGFIVPPKEYFGIIRQICDKHGIVMVADEVQTGICRTGKMFAMEHYGVAADLTTVAKSLGAGMPLGAVVGKTEMMDAPHVGGLGGTYGGNPVSCAAALAVLEYVKQEDLCAKAARVGQMARQRFEAMAEKYPLIGEVRGLGAMLALELVRDPKTKEPAGDEAKKLVDYCHNNGLIALNCGRYGNIIRTLMPLVITDDQLDEGLAILEKGLALVSAK